MVNDCTAERERKCERLVCKIAELMAEQGLKKLCKERDKALESTAQSKATHTQSASLEPLGNPLAPKKAVIENMPMLLCSPILPNPDHGIDMAEHTNYIRKCEKIFQ